MRLIKMNVWIVDDDSSIRWVLEKASAFQVVKK